MANRKAAQDLILKWIKEIDPSGVNHDMYKNDIFPSMSDKVFGDWMQLIRDEKDYIFVNMPNLKGNKITVANNLKVAKKIGVDFFQRISQIDNDTGKRYTGTRKYLVIHLPIRRQIQMIADKISVQEGSGKRDALSGQVTQGTRGSSISYPETLVLYSQGLDRSITELVKARGGDEMASRLLKDEIIATGNASLANIENLPTRAKSTDTLSTMLTAMHIKNNL